MKIYLIENGCPICGGEVKGNPQLKYFCSTCNLLFARQELAHTEQKKEISLKELKTVLEHAPSTKALSDIKTEYSQDLEEEETLVLEHEQEGYELDDPSAFVVSQKSDKVHAGDCHFLKKIHRENRRYPPLSEALEQGYELCVCLRRKKAQGELQGSA